MNNKKFGFILNIGLSILLISCSFLDKIISIIPEKQNQRVGAAQAPTQDIPAYLEFDCISSPEDPEIGWVTYVIDGDSIKAEIDGKEYEIRYIGVNTPEFYSKEKAAAEKATAENMALVKGKKIYLFKDISNTDKYQRLLRYVFTEDYFVNLELVKGGFAESKPYPPDISCQKIFDRAAQ